MNTPMSRASVAAAPWAMRGTAATFMAAAAAHVEESAAQYGGVAAVGVVFLVLADTTELLPACARFAIHRGYVTDPRIRAYADMTSADSGLPPPTPSDGLDGLDMEDEPEPSAPGLRPQSTRARAGSDTGAPKTYIHNTLTLLYVLCAAVAWATLYSVVLAKAGAPAAAARASASRATSTFFCFFAAAMWILAARAAMRAK